MVDIIDRYITEVKARLDAPDAFIEASAYHLVSSLLGRYFRCSFVPGSPNMGLRPNVWFLLSSIPARTRRSTVMNYHNSVYKNVLKTHLIQTIQKAENEDQAMEFVDDTQIEEGSPEGIMDHIDVTSKDTFCYSIISSEFGPVLSNIQNKDYQKGVSSLLSKLYYGESGTVMLSRRKKEQQEPDQKRGRRHIPEGLYVTMFAAMQEPKYYLSPIMVGQGLMRRIVLIYIKSSELSMDHWRPPLDMRGDVSQGFDTIRESMKDLMANYHEMSQNMGGQHKLIDTVWGPRVMGHINKIAKERDSYLIEQESLYNIYMQGFWEHLAKISMLHAIARNSINRDKLLYVEMEDVTKAHDFMNRATKYNQDVIQNLGYSDRVMQDVSEPLNRILDIIKSKPDGCERFFLYRKMNIPKDELDTYVSQLIAQEKISVIQNPTDGRTGIIYKPT